MRNTLILIAICLHIVALLWSCYQPKEVEKRAYFTKASLEQQSTEKLAGTLNLNWNVEPPQDWLEVYVSESADPLEERQLLIKTTVNTIQINNVFNKTTYFHLVTASTDTTLIFEP